MMEYRNDGIVGAQHSNTPLFHHSNPPCPWLFGCDECLLACPFQQSARACANRRFKWYPERAQVDLREALGLSVEEFKAELHDSPVLRLGLGMMKRNAWRCLKSQMSDLK
jgi:epoxyqueuosine reductase QueG